MSDTVEIRKGEGLEKEKLSEFLVREVSDEFASFEIKQFPSGASNLTYALTTDSGEYVLRRPPFGNRVRTAHDMKREFKVLSALHGNYSKSPKPIHHCADENVIGSEFYLMERVQGEVLRNSWPYPYKEEIFRSSIRTFVAGLVELHQVDWRKAGLKDFGKPEGYVKRQVQGWSRRYFDAKTDDWPDVEKAIAWLNDNVPEDQDGVLVHNDYKYDNIVFKKGAPDSMVAVLDWEMATIGSPLMDLGTTLGYWMSRNVGNELLSMPFNPRALMENIDRREIVEVYGELSGRDVSDIDYYYVFGTVKIAVIAQQIYYRYSKGHTQDPRFAMFNKFVGALGRIAVKAM